MDDNDVAVMYITANTTAYITFIFFIFPSSSALLHPPLFIRLYFILHSLFRTCFIDLSVTCLCLDKAALLKAVNPVCCVALCRIIIDAILLGKKLGYGSLVKLLALDSAP
jgi:hypothetical protein